MSTETERVEAAGPDAPGFIALQDSPEFQDLKRKQRRFNITSRLLFGLLQFVTTFIIMLVYVSYANRVLDPAAEKLRNAGSAIPTRRQPSKVRAFAHKLSEKSHDSRAPKCASIDSKCGPLLNRSILAVFVVATLFIVIRASKNNKAAADYYAGGRSFTGGQNGLAISGDYLGAASLMSVVGAIAVYGYDGFLYSVGFLVAWLVALLLVAEMLRNTGKFTMDACLCHPGEENQKPNGNPSKKAHTK